jgi:hypothetical protein
VRPLPDFSKQKHPPLSRVAPWVRRGTERGLSLRLALMPEAWLQPGGVGLALRRLSERATRG